jgi:predicted lipoprotein
MSRRVSPGAAVAAVAAVAFLVVALLFGFTVVSTKDEAALTQEFDPAAYVADNWDAIETAIRDNAVPLADVLNAIQPGPDGKIATEDLVPVAEEMGLITTGDAHVYRVTGSGTVTDVDTSTTKGTIGIAVDGYDGPIKVRAFIGPRIPSDESSIRDATGFIDFGNFRDQTEFGKVAKEINAKVAENLATLDTTDLAGRSIDFLGAMTMRTFNQPTIDVSELELVPLEITVK